MLSVRKGCLALFLWGAKLFLWGALEQMELQVDGFKCLPTKIFCDCFHRAKEGKTRRRAHEGFTRPERDQRSTRSREKGSGETWDGGQVEGGWPGMRGSASRKTATSWAT